MKEENRKCKYCEGDLFGRSNKIFCKKKCKSDYHNKHNPKKRAFKLYINNEKEIKGSLKNIKATIQTELEEIRKGKLLKNKDTDENLYIDFELRKNYDLLSEIKRIEGLLYN